MESNKKKKLELLKQATSKIFTRPFFILHLLLRKTLKNLNKLKKLPNKSLIAIWPNLLWLGVSNFHI